MIHARARCWVHEDCLVDLELSIACGPNPPDMQALDADWAYGGDDWGDGNGFGYGGGDGYGGGLGDGGPGGGGGNGYYGHYGDGDGAGNLQV